MRPVVCSIRGRRWAQGVCDCGGFCGSFAIVGFDGALGDRQEVVRHGLWGGCFV